MEIIKKPSDEQLNKVQAFLDEENRETDVGITDIWGCLSPEYFLAVEEGSPIGVVTISADSTFAEIYKLYVAPPYRRKNIANKLFIYAIDCLRSIGVEQVGIEFTGNSYKFWEKVLRDYQGETISPEKAIIQISS